MAAGEGSWLLDETRPANAVMKRWVKSAPRATILNEPLRGGLRAPAQPRARAYTCVPPGGLGWVVQVSPPSRLL
jgi:hypothetical protein